MPSSGSTLEDDAGPRNEVGVVTSLSRTPDGKIRLILDDVRSTPTLDAQGWRKSGLYTYFDFDGQAFLGPDLSERDLANIGLAIVARLAAGGTYHEARE